MANYYSKVVVEGTHTPQLVEVQAGSTTEAKRVIEARYGKVRYRNGPTRESGNKPPSWFR